MVSYLRLFFEGNNFMKIIRQHDERDCGAACLASIARHYGYRQQLAKFRELTKTDRMGCNIYGLVEGAKKIGLEAEAVCCDLDELIKESKKRTVYPAIALIRTQDNLMHFVVVISIGKKVVLGDPAKGKIIITLNEFLDIWTGYIVFFEKGNSFEIKKDNRKIKYFGKLLKGETKKIILVFILSVFVALIGMAGTFAFAIVIDGISNEACIDTNEDVDLKESIVRSIIERLGEVDSVDKIGIIFITLIGLYFLQGIIHFLRGILIISFSRVIDRRLSISYYNHIIDMPLESISVRNTGEYMSRVSDTYIIREAISEAAITLCLDTLMIIGCGILLFILNSYLFVCSFIVILIYLLIVLVFKHPVESTGRKTMEQDAIFQSYIKESIDGVETIKAMNADNVIKNKMLNIFNNFINAVFKNDMVVVAQDTIITMVEAMGSVIVLWLGFILAYNNVITVGMLITYYALLAFFTEPIKNLTKLQPTIQKAFVAADRLKDIYLMETEQNSGNLYMEKIDSIELNNVDFRYGNRELTLNNINLKVNQGSKVAIVGESGSGKTTLAKLLMGFYHPEKGSILINGEKIENYTLDSIRRNISYIGQTTFLFSDTIENNLKVAQPNATQKEIEIACRKAGMISFIENSSFGYDLVLEENGLNVSGGERQRISIARALLRKPKVLIMDEATSNLDTITENAIYNTVFNSDENRISIIIAHRLSTIKRCDCIYVMEKGKIVEFGTHEELINNKGKYYSLVKEVSLECSDS